jgi:hypothetical protein
MSIDAICCPFALLTEGNLSCSQLPNDLNLDLYMVIGERTIRLVYHIPESLNLDMAAWYRSKLDI